MRARRGSILLALIAAPALVAALPTSASDCEVVTVERVPLSDLGSGLYLDLFAGGLYPDGLNEPPPAHATEGRRRALDLSPLGPTGAPAEDGRIVLLSIGMSNTTQEFCSRNGREPCDPWTFTGQAAEHPLVDRTALVIVNGARGGQAADAWESPAHPNYDRIRDTVLAPRGLTEAQVQSVWVKVADRQPTTGLPAPDADAYDLMRRTGNIVRTLRVRYPNVQLVFLSSRIYAGYATTTLNPEPYAYESGFSMKWLVEAQIEQMAGGEPDPIAGDLDYVTVAPWLGWAAYLWADGLEPRSDGLVWRCEDFEDDGTHPARPAEQKVGGRLLGFFLGSPFTRPWFASAPCAEDVDGSGAVDTADLLLVLSAWGPCAGCPEDVDGDDVVGVPDLLAVLASWGPCG